MALFLSEAQAESLLEMREVVSAVEEAFAREGNGEAVNRPRTRSRSSSSVLNVMHANLGYLHRGGAKMYMSTPAGTRFVFVLFDGKDSSPLAVMGAEMLGRYRTGAASGVATKHLYGKKRAKLAVFGSGTQAFTQVSAVAAITSVDEVRVWSPNRSHADSFRSDLAKAGYSAVLGSDPAQTMEGADVASTITSSADPFIGPETASLVSHMNLCGVNNPEHAELSPKAIPRFDTIVVDDLPQAKVEYGELIQAEAMGAFRWEQAAELKDVVTGKVKPSGRTLFKSGGAALEDVAVASLLYDKARKKGSYLEIQF